MYADISKFVSPEDFPLILVASITDTVLSQASQHVLALSPKPALALITLSADGVTVARQSPSPDPQTDHTAPWLPPLLSE